MAIKNTRYNNVRRCLRKNASARRLLRAVVKSWEEGLIDTKEFRTLMRAAGQIK